MTIRPTYSPKRFSVLFTILLWTVMGWKTDNAHAQNLVPNPNFEIFSNCPTGISQLPLAIPWNSPSDATPDYYNECTNSPAVDVPTNFAGGGYQVPLTGDAYTGCYFKSNSPDFREYLQIQLTTPMEVGLCYNIGFFMNLVNQFCGVNQVGIYITTNPISVTHDNVLPLIPQITGNGGFYSDTVAWMEISGTYTALGGEEYIILGNFRTDGETAYDPLCPNPPVTAYYYIDSVYVHETGQADELPLDLGPDFEACFEQVIDGESGNVNYHWSTGSTASGITVNSTGTYSLTITEACAIGIDSVEFTLIGSDPVLITPTFISLCEGETYTITLDPDAGEYLWNDGSTSHEYVISESGQYAVTLDDGCDLSTDQLLVAVTAFPLPIHIGNDTVLCGGDAFDIILDPGTNTVAWQDGANDAVYTIDDPGVYGVTISNQCGSVFDEIVVTGLEVPEMELGTDTMYLCEGENIVFDFDPDLGEFLWNDGSPDANYVITSAGLYSVTVSNICGSSQDDVVVLLSAEPVTGFADSNQICTSQFPYVLTVAEFSSSDLFSWSTGESSSQILVSIPGWYGVSISNTCFSITDSIYLDSIAAPMLQWPDTSFICPGETLTLEASQVSSAAFEWQDGSTLSSYLVKSPGIYSVTVTNACGSVIESAVVNEFILADPPDLGPDFSLCPGQHITLFANASSGTFTWNDLSTADTLNITTPGTYSVTVQDQCATAADTILVTSDNSPPDLDLPDSLVLCVGQSLVLDANVPGANFLWSDGSMNSGLLVTSPGLYSVTVTSGCGADSDTVLVRDGGSTPLIDLGDDIELCHSSSQVLSPDLSMADSWTWQDGSSGSTFTINTTSQITIEVVNECGSATDTLNAVVLHALPPIFLGNDTSLCEAEMLLLEIDVPDVSITWFDGSNNNQLIVIGGGIYTATISNICESVQDTIIINALPGIPHLSLGPDQFLCPGELFIIDPAISNVQYLWHDGSTDSTFSTTQPGLLVLTISNSCGTITDSLLLVESMQGPQLDLGADVVGCVGDTLTIQAGIGGVNYTWQDSSTLSYFDVSTDANLILHIINACGEDRDTIQVTFLELPSPQLGPDSTLCDDQVLTLFANADEQTTILWQDGSTAPFFLVTTPGLHTLEQSNGCGIVVDSVIIDYNTTPAPFTLGPDVVLCLGESITLQAPFTGDQLIWQDGSSATTLVADQDQVYTLTIANICGSVSDEVDVSINPELPVLEISSLEICPGEVLILDATQQFEAQYLWSTGLSTPAISIAAPGTYAVTVISSCDTVSQQVYIQPGDDCKPNVQFYIPSIFSPNGDHVNDLFTIQFNTDVEVVSVTGTIFDRWGNVIYESNNLPFTWNGSYGGRLLNPGVYVYRFTLVYFNGIHTVTEIVTGDVTVVR